MITFLRTLKIGYFLLGTFLEKVEGGFVSLKVVNSREVPFLSHWNLSC
jgi:hypothetical protein